MAGSLSKQRNKYVRIRQLISQWQPYNTFTSFDERNL